MKKYFRYVLVVVFFAAIIIVVFLQFNSNRNIDRLISGNEDVLESQGIKAELNSLESDIFAFDAKTRTFIIKGEKDEFKYRELLAEAESIRREGDSLQRLGSEPGLSSGITELKNLLCRKLNVNKNLLDTFYINGKDAAEIMISGYNSSKITDSIQNVSNRIDTLHQRYAMQIINKADDHGRRAKTFGSILALLAILASVLTFSYVTFKMIEQRRMIEKLNISEPVKGVHKTVIRQNLSLNALYR